MSGRRAPKRRWGESGFAVPTVLAVMIIVLAFAAVGAAVVIAALSDASRDRRSTEAFQLADSGVNVTHWHMNRHMTANEVQSLVDMGAGVIQTSACLFLQGDTVVADTVTEGAEGFCESVAFPDLNDGEGTTVCWTDVRPDLNDPVSLPGIVERRIVCQGTIDGTSRRVAAKAELSIDVGTGSPTSLWEVTEWVECTSERPPGGLDPAAGCGALETTT